MRVIKKDREYRKAFRRARWDWHARADVKLADAVYNALVKEQGTNAEIGNVDYIKAADELFEMIEKYVKNKNGERKEIGIQKILEAASKLIKG